jgi:FkbM family methyltransferase
MTDRTALVAGPSRGAGSGTVPRKFSARYLRRFQFRARTIFDVGVGDGTPELYRLFPDRRFVLIDPLPRAREEVASRFPGLDFAFYPVALGATAGTAVLNVTTAAAKAGIPARTALTADVIAEHRPVPVTTLDAIAAEGAFPTPFGLKLDTEGYELEILRGADETLRHTEFIIAEVSVKKRFIGGYRFSDAIGFLAARGFELIDILNLHGGMPWFYDCLFVRHDHPLFERTAAAVKTGE